MKKMKIGTKMLIAGGLLLSITSLQSCSKTSDLKSAQTTAAPNEMLDGATPAAIAYFPFDSSWTESIENVAGKPYNHAKFSSPGQAWAGKAAFLSKDSGYVAYDKIGKTSKLNKLTTGVAADFWVYATGNPNGAQCLWALCQTGAFWPDMHVLLDGYNPAQGDTGLVKVMFKDNNPNYAYDEQWIAVGGLVNFYNRWSHIQFSYTAKTSVETIVVNDKQVAADTLYTNDPRTQGGQPLGALTPNPAPHGFVVGTFQNIWNPGLFGAPQTWMQPFVGRIDELKIYDKALKL